MFLYLVAFLPIYLFIGWIIVRILIANEGSGSFELDDAILCTILWPLVFVVLIAESKIVNKWLRKIWGI